MYSVKIEGKELVIRAPLQTPELSSTGKTLVVAKVGTSYLDDVQVDGKPVRVQMNAFIKP